MLLKDIFLVFVLMSVVFVASFFIQEDQTNMPQQLEDSYKFTTYDFTPDKYPDKECMVLVFSERHDRYAMHCFDKKDAP